MKPKFSSNSFSITLLFITIFNTMISSTIIVVADHHHNVVEETCKKFEKKDPNIDYNFCISSFRAHPDIDWADDVQKLGTISLSLIENYVRKSVEYVKKLLLQIKRGVEESASYEKVRLEDCMELYSEAVVAVEEGKRAYKAKRYDDANIKMSSVMDSSRVCEDGFNDEKQGVVSSPMTKWNKDVFQLTAIALSIINMQP